MEQQGFEFRTDFSSEEDRKTYEDAYQEQYKTCEQSLYTGGYRIYTSIDLNMEEQLQNAVDEKLQDFTDVNEEGIYTLQSAAVCIDNETGFVKAIVGGRSQEYDGHMLNRAYQSYRQPGSAIKPLIVYTPALERGYTPDTVVEDAPIEDGPENASGRYLGSVTLRYAVENSINTVAWNLLEEMTPVTGISYLKEMNFAKLSPEDERPAASLGGFTNGVSPVEMAAAYATIENEKPEEGNVFICVLGQVPLLPYVNIYSNSESLGNISIYFLKFLFSTLRVLTHESLKAGVQSLLFFVK